MRFLQPMEENQLFEILDSREEITAVAQLASKMPASPWLTMKEVAAALEGLKGLEECSKRVQNQDDSRECHAEIFKTSLQSQEA